MNADPISGRQSYSALRIRNECCSCLEDMAAAVTCGDILHEGLGISTECPPACMMLVKSEQDVGWECK